MSQDSQHLEFLISQYVDNVLDAPNRKFVEQQLAADSSARELFKRHREAQDLLDDYGSRLPLIDWNEFDASLAARLDAEGAAPRRREMWRRWARPVAAAAALLIAGTLGYGWHAYSEPVSGKVVAGPQTTHATVVSEAKVTINDAPNPAGSVGHATVAEQLQTPVKPAEVVIEKTQPGTPGVTSGDPRLPSSVHAVGPAATRDMGIMPN